jgi:hypothetical protein
MPKADEETNRLSALFSGGSPHVNQPGQLRIEGQKVGPRIAPQGFNHNIQLFNRAQRFIQEKPLLPAQLAGAAQASQPLLPDSKAQSLGSRQRRGQQIDCVHPCNSEMMSDK